MSGHILLDTPPWPAAAAGGDGAPAAVYAGAVDALDPTEINRKLNELKQEHRQLDEDIALRLANIQADELMVKRLKKRKLWLKDCISRLESALIPDEPA